MSQEALAAEVKKYCSQLSGSMKAYLETNLGISPEIIREFEIGQARDDVVSIPNKNGTSKYIGIKFRQSPKSLDSRSRYWHSKRATVGLYATSVLKQNPDTIIITEGELKCLALLSKGIFAISGSGGAGTYKEEWVKETEHIKSVYICYDNDQAGKDGAIKVAKLIPRAKIVTLPDMGEGRKDITDFFVKCGKTKEDFEKLLEEAKSLSELEQEKKVALTILRRKVFDPMSKEELLEVLGHTIKRDDNNKLITFACELTAFSEDAQFNVSFNAPSSTGKSYIPLEISSLFPSEDVNIIGYCSPSAFFHESGLSTTTEGDSTVVHLDRKIIIFLDQPHDLLLQRIRPLLSHDKKEIPVKITDKTKNAQLRTKNIILKGYPSVIFCTAALKLDEQEATRFLLLSPEITQEKIRDSLYFKLNKESDHQAYQALLAKNASREKLKERIYAIKAAHIDYIKIGSMEKIRQFFLEGRNILRPRYLRDVNRVVSLTKAFALLNLWHRDRDGSVLISNDDDSEQALALWKSISQSQELNLPPYVFSIYNDIIIPLCLAPGNHNFRTTRHDIMKKHFELYERPLPEWQLRKEILMMLETAGLIMQEKDQEDKRKTLIYLVNEDKIKSIEAAKEDEIRKALENL